MFLYSTQKNQTFPCQNLCTRLLPVLVPLYRPFWKRGCIWICEHADFHDASTSLPSREVNELQQDAVTSLFQCRVQSRWSRRSLSPCCDFRAAESTEEVTKLRPVRLIREDGIIRPYDLTESQGFDLFQV